MICYSINKVQQIICWKTHRQSIMWNSFNTINLDLHVFSISKLLPPPHHLLQHSFLLLWSINRICRYFYIIIKICPYWCKWSSSWFTDSGHNTLESTAASTGRPLKQIIRKGLSVNGLGVRSIHTEPDVLTGYRGITF